MAILGGDVGYRILRRIAPGGRGTHAMDGSNYIGKSKIRMLLGDAVVDGLAGLTVIDFGCGEGEACVELVKSGAKKAIGIDIQSALLEKARRHAASAGVLEQCEFVTHYNGDGDAMIAIDSFEHFDNPAAILDQMARLLKPGARLYASFGPTWYHPLGGHLFSVFPWAHLLFTESALIRWRTDFKTDGATRFREVAGGLNQMTIARFEKLVGQSQFTIEKLTAVPIRKLKRFHNRFTREFTTAIVQAILVRK